MSPSLRAVSAARFSGVALATLSLVLFVGCINSPHVDSNNMSCRTDDNCLVGYTCVAGTCQGPAGNPKDAEEISPVDATAPLESGVPGADGSTDLPQSDAPIVGSDTKSPADTSGPDGLVSDAGGAGGTTTGAGGTTTGVGGTVGTGGITTSTGGGGAGGGNGGTGGASSTSTTGCSPLTNPDNPCQTCQLSTQTWISVPDGASCGLGKVCNQGSCISGCFVDGMVRPEGTASPGNPCQSCQSGTSTSAFSNVADGFSCGSGQYCGGGQCGTECNISGTPHSSGTVNPSNACTSCQPATSSSVWSARPDGTSCATGKVCATGSCVSACNIGGSIQTSGTANPTNSCQSCQPSASTTAWSNIANGTSCASQAVCNNGSCYVGCYISGAVYASAAANPTNGCQSCQPSASTTVWTTSADGASCGTGQVCRSGICIHQVIFEFTGAAQSWVVPAGITQITVTAAGAQGGPDIYSNQGGKGALVTATLAVTPGETLVVTAGGAGGLGSYLTPGPGGFNGGGPGGATVYNGGYSGGGGGGASDVRRGGTALTNRIIVAGGGGGGGVDATGTVAGGPGGAVGGSGTDDGLSLGGRGGDAAGGGGGGAGDASFCGQAGSTGELGVGGPGGANTCGYGSGGGGGGGYYGGGGGGGGQVSSGGGGGSSYPSGVGVTISSGVQSGNGQVVIVY
jgi:hypothetical protein